MSQAGRLLGVMLWGVLVGAMNGCVGQAEPAPASLSEYLDDLVAGRFASAYERTQLAELGSFSQGGAVSQDHFESFYRANPLESFEIIDVVRLDRRAPDQLGEQGTPEWEVEVRMVHDSGPVEASFGVIGEVLARVIVTPVAIDVLLESSETPRMQIDGVAVDLANAQIKGSPGRWRIVLLDGRHLLEVNEVTVIFDAEPLRVVEGPATVEGEASGIQPQTLRITTAA